MEQKASSGGIFGKNWWKWLLLPLGLLALLVYFIYDPATAGIFPPCIFRTATGLKCPGCGSQRALHQIIHGNIAGAFAYNPLLVLSIPYVVLGVWLDVLGGRNRFPRFRYVLLGGYAPLVWAVLVIAYTIARNIWAFDIA